MKAKLPTGFVYLKDVDPSIIQNVRYATKNNFIGEVIPGYNASEIILTNQAAKALANVQSTLLSKGYSLVVYDGYRPQKSVDYFMDWSKNDDFSQKDLYYQIIDNKSDLFSKDYIAKKSGHSRGSTVDLTIIELGKDLHEIEIKEKSLTKGRAINFLDDGTVEMGTSFDTMHPASHHDTNLVSQGELQNREILRQAMINGGFKEYKEEWWHYTLKDELFPETYFDFDIES